MNKNDFYYDYLLIREMKSPTKVRYRLLSELMGSYHNAWRVVGVTHKAIEVFSKYDFKRVSRMGINRSHIMDRKTTYTEMLEGPLMEIDEWWEYFLYNDRTILATSAENMSNGFGKIYPVDEQLGLFKPQGFAWVHKDHEINFLQETYNLTADEKVYTLREYYKTLGVTL